MSVDREGLRRWYLDAMARRIEELRGVRAGVTLGEQEACDAARAVAQALRGSGGTFGFPSLSAAAALVESAPNGSLLRRVEGLIEHLHGLREEAAERPPVRAEWLMRAAERPADGSLAFGSIESAWEEAASARGIGQDELARRAAAILCVQVADLSRANRAALRLVPEALMRAHLLLPLAEDPQTIEVAAADPTSLEAEGELIRTTGRTPVLSVADPGSVASALSAMLATAGGSPRPRLPASRAARGPHRVLVVDDDPGSRLLASAVLTKRGYEVVQAEDGVEALHRLRGHGEVSLVVADLNMPHMDGLELLWEIRRSEELKHVPVVVLTGETDAALEAKLIEEGADDYVCKPLDPRLFLARVGATIRRAEERDPALDTPD